MASPTLTTEEVQALYVERLAVREHTFWVTTRTACYVWAPELQLYELLNDGLHVQHRAGAAWSHRRQCFVPCACRWCDEHPQKVADVDLYDPSTQKE